MVQNVKLQGCSLTLRSLTLLLFLTM